MAKADPMKLVREAAKQHGAEVAMGKEGRFTSLSITLPVGKLWSANDSHTLVGSWYGQVNKPTWQEEKAECCQDFLDRMALGTHECDDAECDHCHPE